jgi:hypothetical protein
MPPGLRFRNCVSWYLGQNSGGMRVQRLKDKALGCSELRKASVDTGSDVSGSDDTF